VDATAEKGQDLPRQIHARIVEDTNGPGPRFALIYKKNAEPKKRKMALTMEGCTATRS
jgi:hypothetical protein